MMVEIKVNLGWDGGLFIRSWGDNDFKGMPGICFTT
jgi:hypothetical protein